MNKILTQQLMGSRDAFVPPLQPAGASAPPTPLPWQSVWSQTPPGLSTALAFNGALLALGGGDYGAQPSIIINLATGAGSRLGSCLLNDVIVYLYSSPHWGCSYVAGGYDPYGSYRSSGHSINAASRHTKCSDFSYLIITVCVLY